MEVTAVEPAVEATEQAVLEQLLAERAVRTVFQPLIALDSGQVLGFEALSRGPAGSVLERPELLLAAARRGRRLRNVDLACRAAALQAARSAGLATPYRLFINAEPGALGGWRPSVAHEQLPLIVVLELTERALTSQPAQLLQTVARVRALGWGVALDDVGADPASLALLPLVQPDVIKLDLALVQKRPSAHIAAVVNAVHAEAERSGTVVLAEGIETAEHLRTARAFGATVGQGWYFGRPGPLPSPLPAFGAAGPLPVMARRAGTDDPSPFDLAATQRPARDATSGCSSRSASSSKRRPTPPATARSCSPRSRTPPSSPPSPAAATPVWPDPARSSPPSARGWPPSRYPACAAPSSARGTPYSGSGTSLCLARTSPPAWSPVTSATPGRT